MEIPKIGILVFENVEELDFIGPWEVFTAAEALARGIDSPAINTFLISVDSKSKIRCAKGLEVFANQDISRTWDLDILLIPGGRGTRAIAFDQSVLEWIKTQAKKSKWLASVCTGALLLNNAGLINNCEVTTHWAFADHLQSLNPKIQVRKEKRVIFAGKIATAAGVSAGIDLALHFVKLLYSENHAIRTQKYIQYAPEAPFSFDLNAEEMFPNKPY